MAIPTPPRTVNGYVDDTAFDIILADALETVPDLTWPTSVQTYAAMRRDAQLAAVLGGYTLQLRRASWQLDGRDCRPEVVQLVSDDLGLPVAGQERHGAARTRGVSWTEHLRTSLAALTFGHAGFEMQADVSSGQARLVGLWDRPQWTISHIHVDGKSGALLGVTQDAPFKQNAPQIRADRLVWYAHEREGAGWYGTSLLRPAYGPWLIKREMQRVLATSNRRFGMGVPTIEWAAGTNPTPAQHQEAQRAASAARVGDQSGQSLPPGAHLVLTGLSGGTPDTLAFLKWLDQQMSRMALMGHLDLGQTETGSRALGESFIDLWMLALESIGDETADAATRQAAARLVEWNWGPDEAVPRVTVSGIGSRRDVTAESLQMLLGSGALAADPALEEWVRREYRLPPRANSDRPAVFGGEDVGVAAAAPASDSPVDPQQLQDDYEQAVEDAKSDWEEAAGPLVAALAAAVAAEVAAGMLPGVAALSVPAAVMARLVAVVDSAMLAAAQRTARRLAGRLRGLGIEPTVSAEHRERIRRAAQAATDLIVSGYRSGAARAALNLAGPGAAPQAVESAVAAHLRDLSQPKGGGLVASNLGAALTSAQGEGMWAIYEQLPDDTRYRASEINDKGRCKPCAEIDDHEYDSIDDARTDYPTMRYRSCLGGDRCRGFVFPIFAPSNTRGR